MKIKTPSELLAEKNAKANQLQKLVAGQIGSPYRIHEYTTLINSGLSHEEAIKKTRAKK
jgi:hypothetical protein